MFESPRETLPTPLPEKFPKLNVFRRSQRLYRVHGGHWTDTGFRLTGQVSQVETLLRSVDHV